MHVSNGDWGSCQENCVKHATTQGIRGCCEGRTSGYCVFYPNGNISYDGYSDAKAVLCLNDGKETLQNKLEI